MRFRLLLIVNSLATKPSPYIQPREHRDHHKISYMGAVGDQMFPFQEDESDASASLPPSSNAVLQLAKVAVPT